MKCMKCREADIPEPQMCCSGYMCGCMGLPIDPPYCDKCWDELGIDELLSGSATKGEEK